MTITMILDVPGVQVTPSLSGTYIPNSEKQVNFNGLNYIRQEIDANLLGLKILTKYSVDSGSTWDDFTDGEIVDVKNAAISQWFQIPQAAKTECLVRAYVVGVVTCRVRFVELETRG